MSPSPRAQALLSVLLAGAIAVLAAGQGLPRGDLANYWTAAALVAEGADLSRLYDYRWFTEQAARLGWGDQLVGFPVLTPPSALFVLPLLPLGLDGGRLAWAVLQVVLALATGLVAARAARLPAWSGLLAVLLAWPALRAHLVQGQLHLPAALALAGGYLAWSRRRDGLAGACWGLAAGLKLFAWPLVLLPLLARRPRATLAALGVLLVGGAVSLGVLGWELHLLWLREILPASAAGWFMDPWHPAMQSLAALSHALWLDAPRSAAALWFPSTGLGHGLPAALAALLPAAAPGCALAWPRLSPGERARLLSLGALAPLAGAPFLTSYSLVLLVPVAVVALGPTLREGARGRATGMVIAGLLACWAPVPTGWPEGPAALLAVPRAWALLALCGLLLPSPRGRPRVALGLAAAGLLALVAGLRAGPEVALDVDGARPVDAPGQPLILAELRLAPDGEGLLFSAVAEHRAGAAGRGWLGFTWPLDEAGVVGRPSPVSRSAEAHTWAPDPESGAFRVGPGHLAEPRELPCGAGQLAVVQADDAVGTDLVAVVGEAREPLTLHPSQDAWPVCDLARGRVWFLSDRGVGVRALQLWWVPLPAMLAP